MIQAAIHSLLVADPALAAMISTRVYSEKAPADAAEPYIVFRRAAGGRDCHAGGTLSLQKALFAFACWDAPHLTAQQVLDRLTTLLSGAHGSYAGIAVRGVFVRDAADLDQPPFSADELGPFGKTTNVEFWFVE